jgi:pimeloyl-ACP methyl ester carboxylesterase
MADVERVEFKVGDFAFDALAAGPADGDAVFLLHGFPESSFEWRHQLAALGAAGYRAIAPDQRGYSPGARPPEVAAYRVDHLSADVLAMADDVGAHRFHLVGHDWGSGPAWYIAGRWPERLKSVTSISVPHPKAFAAAYHGEIECDQKEKSSYMDFFRMEGIAEDVMLPRMRDMFVAAGLGEEVADAHARIVATREGLTGGLNWYRANHIEALDVPDIEIPTLFVWSDGDVYLGREAAEATGRFVKGPYRFEVVEGVDHWVPEKAPERVNELLLEHFSAHSS